MNDLPDKSAVKLFADDVKDPASTQENLNSLSATWKMIGV